MPFIKYIPKIIDDNLATFSVEFDVCPICKQKMVILPDSYHSPFPKWRENNFAAQAKRAGFRFMSGSLANGENICRECEAAGKASFLCALCDEQKPSFKIKECFGDAAEYLCTDCYENVTAKVWIEKCKKLREDHKYDFC